VSAGRPPRGTGQVVVVGAINVDFVIAADRLPGPGETVVGAGLERHGGGKGANAAVAAARAGAAVSLIGAVGDDDTGAAALADLRTESVEVGGVAVLNDQATGVALIVVDRRGENQIAVGAGANAALSAAHVTDTLAGLLPTAGCVLVSTEVSGEAVAAAVRAATAADVTCVLNTAPPIPEVSELLERGPLLTPNAGEVEDLIELLGARGESPALNGSLEGRHAIIAAHGELLRQRTQAPVVITLGADGALVLAPGGAADHVPAVPAAVQDTTGAGDAFNGALAARLADGEPLEDAVRFATAAASLSVTRVGARAGMPERSAVELALASIKGA
jgi:ribokinase